VSFKIVMGVLVLVAMLTAGWLWTPDRNRALLEARYANAPTDFIEVAGLRLHVRDSGPKDAPVVILLHGFGASLHTWEVWAQALSADYRVIRYDLPGAGLTGADPTGDYSDTRGMQVLVALMDALGVQQASLIGHSMGGRMAWRFAAQYPARLDKLVLISPDGFASPGFEYGKKPDVPAMLKLMRYVLPKPILRMSLAPAYADPSVMTDDLLQRYYDMMLAPSVRAAMIARMEQSILQDPVPMLKQIQAPTLLVWGEKDAMIPVSNAADYVRALPKATLVTLPGVGHLPHEEAPAVSLQAVKDFLLR
jgi:pimeloyl-ACP methyl ester carboxylesterase